MKLTRNDLDLIRKYITAWDVVNDQPLTTPGPDSLYKPSGDSNRYSEENLDMAAVVDQTILDMKKTEKVDPRWMGRLIIHKYRYGLPCASFRLYDDPAKGNIPLGLIALGYDAETLVKARLLMFRVRLLAKIDESIKAVRMAG